MNSIKLTDEAIESAAKALHSEVQEGKQSWHTDLSEKSRRHYRREAHAALSAAIPYLETSND